MALTPASWRVFRRRFFVACFAALVALVSSIVVLNLKVTDTLASTKRIGGLSFPDGPAEGGNYLIVGSDSRAFVDNATQAKAFGTAQEQGGQRADVMMVLHIDPGQKTNLLVSFPRDLLVTDPASGKKVQINGLFNNGPQPVIDMLNKDFNVKVNHFVQVDFQAFIGVVDAIGKVGVYFPYPARDTFSGLDIGLPGCSQLDGNGALAYVRSRHLEYLENGRWTDASPRADLDRITRQQDFIRKLASQASAKAGENPLDAIDIANAIVPKLHVDQQLSNDNILRLVRTFRNVDPKQPGALDMQTIPTFASRSQPGRLEVQYPDAEQLLARLRSFGDAAATTAKVRPADVVVSVLNGSDKAGAAGRAIADLQVRGFGPGDPGNTAATAKTLVRYKSGEVAQAELVSQYLGGVGQLVEDSSVSDVDVVVVIGADWRGVSGKGQKAEAPSTTSTTAAKSGSGKGSKASTSAAPAC
ncbi:MAG: LCP family protein [Acidimicrobiia bacterium]